MINQEPHIRDYFQVILRRKGIIFTFFLVLVIGVLFGSLRKTPLYRSEATILIEQRSPKVVSFQEVSPMGTSYNATIDYYQTQYRLITSRSVLKKVAKELGMDIPLKESKVRLTKFQHFIRKAGHFLGFQPVLMSFKKEVKSPTEELDKMVSVKPEKNSQLVKIRVVNSNPKKAKRIANTVARVYIEQNLERNITLANDAAIWLSEKIEEKKMALRKSEIELQEFRSSHNRDVLPLLSGKEALEELKTEYTILDAKYANFAKRYTKEHPKMIELKAQLEKLKSKIETLEDADVGAIATEYRVLEREVTTNKQMYETLLQRLKEINLTSTLQSNNITLIDEAEIPEKPFKPNIKLNLFLAVFLGLFVGIGLGFFIDYLDTTVKSIQDVTEILGSYSLGTVPKIEKISKKQYYKIVIDEPKSLFSEAIRSIRTEILLVMNEQKDAKTILITGSSPEEGKTTLASNLALSLAQKGSKVLLVDNDLRRPHLHKIYNLDKTNGLSDFLTENVALETILKDGPLENIKIITSGKIPPNPSELISSPRMDTFINQVKSQFDIIVFDAPPIANITDSIILADKLDTSIQVIRSGKELVPIALRAKERLTQAKAKHLGAILNIFSTSQGDYYDRYYKYSHKE